MAEDIEEIEVVDLGDAVEETLQTAPGGSFFDSIYGWGWTGG